MPLPVEKGYGMGNLSKKLLIIVAVAQFLVLMAVAFYFGGIRHYGTPGQYRSKQTSLKKASVDSLKAAENTRISPENAGDSLMYDIGRHIKLFESTGDYDQRIKQLQASLDSLKREKENLDKTAATVSSKESLLKVIQDQAKSKNIVSLSKMFESMNTQQAVPVMIDINDTLAVQILTNMQSRNSAKLLGAIAQVDTAKAVRLSRLIARMGVLEGK
jgi:flagellar motility protein MotE (MotC chaperone)